MEQRWALEPRSLVPITHAARLSFEAAWSIPVAKQLQMEAQADWRLDW
jgi:hypothetical protein